MFSQFTIMVSSSMSADEVREIQTVFCLTRELVNPRIITYPNGAVYKGETTTFDIRHGYGELLYTNATVLAVKWKNGVACGKGVYMSSSITYKGDFKNHKFHGHGRMMSHDEEYYDGAFENGERNGYGEALFTTLDVYINAFVHTEPCIVSEIVGNNTVQMCKNGNNYKGYWKNDAFNGTGSLVAQGNVYTGKWNNNCLSKDELTG